MTPLHHLDPDYRARRLRLDLMFWHRDFSKFIILSVAAVMALTSFTRFGPVVLGLWFILGLGYIAGTGDNVSERTYWQATLGSQVVVGLMVIAAIAGSVLTA